MSKYITINKDEFNMINDYLNYNSNIKLIAFDYEHDYRKTI